MRQVHSRGMGRFGVRERLKSRRNVAFDIRAALPQAGAETQVQRLQSGQGFDPAHRFEADPDDLADQAHDVLGVVGAVGVGDDSALLVFAHRVLVNHPFNCAPRSPAGRRGACYA